MQKKLGLQIKNTTVVCSVPTTVLHGNGNFIHPQPLPSVFYPSPFVPAQFNSIPIRPRFVSFHPHPFPRRFAPVTPHTSSANTNVHAIFPQYYR
jgi:hypothetical protein